MANHPKQKEQAKVGLKAQPVHLKPDIKWAGSGFKKKEQVGVDPGANDPCTLGVHLKPSIKWAPTNNSCNNFYLGKEPGGLGFKKNEWVEVDPGANNTSTLGKESTTAWRIPT